MNIAPHWHGTVDHIVLYGVSALIFFNLWKLAAAKAGTQPGLIGTVGRSAGALVHFGG